MITKTKDKKYIMRTIANITSIIALFCVVIVGGLFFIRIWDLLIMTIGLGLSITLFIGLIISILYSTYTVAVNLAFNMSHINKLVYTPE